MNSMSVWRSVCQTLGLHGIEQEWNYIIGQYSESTRYHHTLSHLDSTIRVASKFYDVSNKDCAIALFALYYVNICLKHPFNDSGSQFNINAFVAKIAFIRLGGNLLIADRIYQLIIGFGLQANKRLSDKYAKLLYDIYYGVLTLPFMDYVRYTENLRKEYPSLSNLQFFLNRSRLLIRLLKSRIYYSEEFLHEEEKARKNIIWELKLIRNKFQ